MARTAKGVYVGSCESVGAGFVRYQGVLNDVFVDVFGLFLGAGPRAGTVLVGIEDDYQCTAGSGGGVGGRDRRVSDPSGPHRTRRRARVRWAVRESGPFAAFAGAQGVIAVDLLTRLSVLNLEPWRCRRRQARHEPDRGAASQAARRPRNRGVLRPLATAAAR